jgi:hypothetical protein
VSTEAAASSSQAGLNKKWHKQQQQPGGSTAPDEESLQDEQLLGPGAVSSSSDAVAAGSDGQQQQQSGSHLTGALGWWQRRRRRQQHALPQLDSSHESCEPGREANVLLTLAGMLRDVSVVATGPERRAFGIACTLAVFDQATASTAIINYAPLVLASSRLGVASARTAIMYPAAISAAKALGVVLALLLVDRAGRKPLLIWGGVGCSAALLAAGCALWAGSVALFLASLCVFIFAFSLSWAGLYWVVVSELFSMVSVVGGARGPSGCVLSDLLRGG